MPATAAPPLIAVLDTNVVVAGLLWVGAPNSLLLRATERQDLVLVTSPMLMIELADTLALARFRKRIADAATSVDGKKGASHQIWATFQATYFWWLAPFPFSFSLFAKSSRPH